MTRSGLRFGALGPETAHVCIDMQRLFAEPTEWHTPGLHDILGNVARLCDHAPKRTILTRFLAPRSAGEARGHWQAYYGRWQSVLADRNDPDLYDLVPALRPFVPPARLWDKTTYSAFGASGFEAVLAALGARTLVLSGVETDVCVLASALDAVDHGYRVVLVDDAVASSDPASHAATLAHVIPRYDQQIECLSTQALLEAWKP